MKKEGFIALPMFAVSIAVKKTGWKNGTKQNITACQVSAVYRWMWIWEFFASLLTIKYVSNTLQSMSEKRGGNKSPHTDVELRLGRWRLQRALQEQLRVLMQ